MRNEKFPSKSLLQNTVCFARQKMIAACDHSMPRWGQWRAQSSMYWWNGTLSGLRSTCNAARRKPIRSKGDPTLHEEWKIAKVAYKKAIKRSQLQCWRDLIGEVEKDPWGLDFKIVTIRNWWLDEGPPVWTTPIRSVKSCRPCFREWNHSSGRIRDPARPETRSPSLSRN